MSMWAATAATAAVYPVNYFQTFPRPRLGVKTITLRESEAKAFVVGNYVEVEGRLWRVAKRTPSSDWFSDEIHVRLHGAHYVPLEESGMFTTLLSKLPWGQPQAAKVNWLEDEAFGDRP